MLNNTVISQQVKQFYFFSLYFSALLLQNVLTLKFAMTEGFNTLHPKQKRTQRLMGVKMQ